MSFAKLIYPQILALACLFIACHEDDSHGLGKQELVIMPDKIICENCYSFGSFIAVDGTDVVVTGHEKIYFFEESIEGLSLNNCIDLGQSSGIQSILLRNGFLYIGIAESNGTGIVQIYYKSIDRWEKFQELRIGRAQDNFGCSIDVSDIYLVIGANAPWVDGIYNYWENKDAGKVYVYKRMHSTWMLEGEFLSENSHADDRFGQTVAIHGKYFVVGPLLHIYENSGRWALRSVGEYYISKLVHTENHFLVKGGDNKLYNATLDEKGGFVFHEISIESPGFEVSGQGEKIELSGQVALVDSEQYGSCLVLRYENDKWIELLEINPIEDEYCDFFGLAISDQHVFVGGNGYVYSVLY